MILTLFASIAVANPTISIYVDGKQIQSDTPPQIVNNRTLVPIRVIAEALDAQVDYDASLNRVIITTKAQAVSENYKLLKLDNEPTTWPYWQENGHLYMEYRNCNELLRTVYSPPWHIVKIFSSGTVNIDNKSVKVQTKQFGDFTAVSLNDLQRLKIIQFKWDEANQSISIDNDFNK